MILRFTYIAVVLFPIVTSTTSAQGCRVDPALLMPRVEYAASQNDRTVSLSGKVVESEAGNALTFAVVKVIREQNPSDTAARAMTTGDGTFRIDSLATGSYQLVINRIGYKRVTRTVRLTGHSITCVTLSATGEEAWGPIVSFPTVEASDALQIATAIGTALGSDLKRLTREEDRSNCVPSTINGQNAAFNREVANAASQASGLPLASAAAPGSRVFYSVDAIRLMRSTSIISTGGNPAPYVDHARVAIEVHGESSGVMWYKQSFEEILERRPGGWSHVGREFLTSTIGVRRAPACR